MPKKLIPKCIPKRDFKKSNYDEVNGVGKYEPSLRDQNRAQCLGHSAQGFILPCCWMDLFPLNRDNGVEVFFQEKFKISNVKDIKEITHSKEWVQFYIMLQEHPEDAPPICYRMCSEDSVNEF